MNELAQLLHQLEASRFFGSLEVKFEAGHVVLLQKTETLKPTQPSYGNNQGTNYQRNQSH